MNAADLLDANEEAEAMAYAKMLSRGGLATDDEILFQRRSFRGDARAGLSDIRKGRKQLGSDHGTQSAYAGGCRCTECRTAHAAYCRERRQAGYRPPLRKHQHGTRQGYDNGCREECCRKAHREYTAELRRRKRQGAA